MNYTYNSYKPPSLQSDIYKNNVLIINNKPYKTVCSSIHLENKTSHCNIINNENEGIKHSSYQRYLNKKKTCN